MTSIEDRIARLEGEMKLIRDREQITDGLNRYAIGVDRADADILRSCYHPDAIESHATAFYGNAWKFVEYIVPQMREFFNQRHTVSNISIDLKGKQAFVQSQFWCLARINLVEDDPAQGYIERDSVGRYLDIWEERDNDWRVQFRHLVLDGATARLITDQKPLIYNDLYGKPSRDDPFYLGFDLPSIRRLQISLDNETLGTLSRKQFQIFAKTSAST